MPRRSLTVRQRRFVAEYQIDFNATQAAKRAGYSPRTAYAAGSRLLKDVEVSRVLAASDRHEREISTRWWRAQVVSLYERANDAGDMRTVFRILEMAGRHLGAFDGSWRTTQRPQSAWEAVGQIVSMSEANPLAEAVRTLADARAVALPNPRYALIV